MRRTTFEYLVDAVGVQMKLNHDPMPPLGPEFIAEARQAVSLVMDAEEFQVFSWVMERSKTERVTVAAELMLRRRLRSRLVWSLVADVAGLPALAGVIDYPSEEYLGAQQW